MTAGKAFDKVVAAYAEATGQSKDEAKADVAGKLAEAWALGAFGSGIQTRVAAANAEAAAEAAPEEGEER